MASCELCHQRIEWFPTGGIKPNGAPVMMPVDPVPVPNGNVVIESNQVRVLTKKEITRFDNPGMLDLPPPDRYVSHFTTCPHAERFHRCRKCHRTPCQCSR